MIDRFVSMLMAVFLALLIWLYTRSREQDMLDNVQLPVEIAVATRQAEHYNLEIEGPRQVHCSFTGPPQRIRELHMMLQRKELHAIKTITIPTERLEDARIADVIVVESSDINAPVGITAIVAEGRNRIPYTLHRLVERRLPVRFDALRDSLPGTIQLDPPTVLVRGPREVLDRAAFISTQPSDLPTRPLHGPGNLPAIGRVPLVEELEGRPVRVVPSTVTVRMPAQVRKRYELTDLQVQFLCPANFHLRPKFIDERAGKVSLRVIGPVQDEPPKVQVFIDLSKGKFVSGLNHEPLQIQLPRDFQLAQEAPRVVAFELLPGDFMPDGLGIPTPATTPTSTVPPD